MLPSRTSVNGLRPRTKLVAKLFAALWTFMDLLVII
jgi:hypothetical protein